MKHFFTLLLAFTLSFSSFAQNRNLSNGNIFDGEPYLAINPNNSQHLVVAWMSYEYLSNISIDIATSFNGGLTWSTPFTIAHYDTSYSSADPTMSFDMHNNVYIAYVDFNKTLPAGAVYLSKSTDGGLNWNTPVEVINLAADSNKYPIDRPWLSIDNSGGANDGNIYVTTIPPKDFGVLPPYHPYFIMSSDGGNSFEPWKYLDTTNWLAGNVIGQPMPTNCVSADGIFYAVYPSYLASQSQYPKFILASYNNSTNSFTYNTVLSGVVSNTDSLAKKSYLLLADPSNANHLVFMFPNSPNGDIDLFMMESSNKGLSWSNAIRINDDPIANNRLQDMLWADFDNDGDLVVSWRDRRNAPSSTYETSYEFWGAVKKKDSSSFDANFMISDNLIAYDTILALSGNDFMCTKLVNDTISTVWGDNRSGALNIWFQRLTIDGNIVSIQQINKANIDLKLYPNPADDNINIISKNIVKAVIYNQSGQLIYQNEYTKEDEIDINIAKLNSGIYFIEIQTESGVVSRRFVKK